MCMRVSESECTARASYNTERRKRIFEPKFGFAFDLAIAFNHRWSFSQKMATPYRSGEELKRGPSNESKLRIYLQDTKKKI